ncbi:uncharacterized protein Dmoj_GI26472 [Drosophila mojavensis]|uniref:Uncharacterized protein n=1 Tax=Drosophila mojavensis TaxID=7230 RepID=A0A0Q9XI25_DROMO|nr:uncharacterized protein Dmoj_GI26472 [Drosophila mojavensis]
MQVTSPVLRERTIKRRKFLRELERFWLKRAALLYRMAHSKSEHSMNCQRAASSTATRDASLQIKEGIRNLAAHFEHFAALKENKTALVGSGRLKDTLGH